MAAGAPTAAVRALEVFGAKVGLACQIADDVLDYRGDTNTLGKSLGDDLAEGKLTLPIIIALQRGSEQDKALLREVIAMPQAEAQQFHAVMTVLEACGALDESLARAQREAAAAAAEITSLPDTQAKRWMLELCAYSVKRNA